MEISDYKIRKILVGCIYSTLKMREDQDSGVNKEFRKACGNGSLDCRGFKFAKHRLGPGMGKEYNQG